MHPRCDQLAAFKTVYALTSFAWPYGRLRYPPTEFECFLKLSADKLLLFKWSQAQVQFFKCVGNMKLCLWAALFKLWFQTDLGRENSASFSHHGHALVTLCPIFMLWLVKIWPARVCLKFIQHLETCLLIADSWSWEGFVSSCDVCNCLFPLNVQNEIQLLSRFFGYSWLVWLLGFWLRNVPLVKVIGNLISDGSLLSFILTSPIVACCLCTCFNELYLFYSLLLVSFAILIAAPLVFSRT